MSKQKAKSDLPKISIVIPSYNKGEYIEQTLASIFIQNYPNLEVIIQDGGSTDNTVELIKQYARKYPKVIQWESKKDKGQLDAINKGLKKATGEILTYINGDDVYAAGALLAVGNYFDAYPAALWLAGKGNIIDKEGDEISPFVSAYKNTLLRFNNYSLLLIVNYLVQPSVFIRRSAYEEHGPFTGTKKYILEYDLWLKLGKHSMPATINKRLSSFRLTKENISSTQYKNVLGDDYEIVSRYTSNDLVLLLHRLHNWWRVLIVKDNLGFASAKDIIAK